MIYTIAIYEKEEDYGRRLIDYIKVKHKNIKAHMFTNLESLKEYIESHIIDFILLGERVELEKEGIYYTGQVCYLTSERKEVTMEATEKDITYPIIFKYQSADKIIKEAMSCLALKKETILTKPSTDIKFIAVYSMDCKNQQSITSYQIAREYSKTQKVLYISLQGNSPLTELLSLKNENHLSQVIYYIKQKHPQLKEKIQAFLYYLDELPILQGIFFEPDIYEITEEDIKLWISQMSMWMEYEIILFCVGSLTKGMLTLLTCSDEIIFVQGKGEAEKKQWERFYRQLIFAGYEELTRRTRVIEARQDTI